MKGTFQIVGWKGLFYQGGREGGRRESLFNEPVTIMHITRGGPRNQGAGGHGRRPPRPHGEPGGRPACESSVPTDPPMHITLVSLLFHVIFFIPKNIF